MEEGMDIALLRLEDPIDQSAVEISPWRWRLKRIRRWFIGFYCRIWTSIEISECTDFCLTDGSGDYSQRRA